MRYNLMHKNVPVLDFVLDNATSSIIKIGIVHHPEHLPVGISVNKGKVDRAALNEWWRGRAIPASRQGIHHALEQLEVSSTQKLLDKCLGLSLSDQYWIKPDNAEVTWSQVNFFENTFSDDVGNILFGEASSSKRISLMSPDNTSDGWLKKKWSIIDGKRCLIKGGSGATHQEPYNEVFATVLMEHLEIPHAAYNLMIQDDYPYSICEDFITPQTELISAWYVMQTCKKENHVSVYQHYLNCCNELGIPGIEDALNRMMVVDYLIVNEDRHQNNFGVIRNADTLEWIGAAPIYDSGTSLWFNSPTAMISSAAHRAGCKPFKSSHDEQIKLVTSFDWIDLSALQGIGEEFRSIAKGSLFIDEIRCNAICTAIDKRVEHLDKLIAEMKHSIVVPDLTHEVHTDIAYSETHEFEEDDLEL